MKKNITLLALIALLASIAAATPTANLNISNSSLEPGQNQSIGTLEIESTNGSFETSDISTNQIPFEIDTTQNSGLTDLNGSTTYEEYLLNASVPSGFEAGNYPGNLIISFQNASNIQKPLNLTVKERKTWNLTNSSSLQNFSVGENGDYGALNFENTGNSKVELRVNTTGNLSDYISIDERANVFPGLEKQLPIQYQASSDVPFGNYTGQINVTAAGKTEILQLQTEVLDEIEPTIEASSINGFQASLPNEFSATVTDNLKPDSVLGKVYYTETVQEGNQTIEVTRIQEEFRFATSKNSDKWTATMSNTTRPGDYKINVTATDESGNNVTQTSSFTIQELSVLRPQRNVQLPAYIYDSNVKSNIGELAQNSPVTVRLSSFNQEIGADWQLGLTTPSGEEYFDEVNDTIELTEAQDLELFVYSQEPGKYNGELTYEPIDSHVPVPQTAFNGQFTNHTNPKDQEFSLYDTIYDCQGFPSQQLNQSYWSCNFNISAGKVEPGSSLQEEVQFAIPSQVRNDKISLWETQVEDAESSAMEANRHRNYSLGFAGFLLFLSIYFITGYPRHYSIHRKSSWDADIKEANTGERIKELLPERLGGK